MGGEATRAAADERERRQVGGCTVSWQAKSCGVPSHRGNSNRRGQVTNQIWGAWRVRSGEWRVGSGEWGVESGAWCAVHGAW